MDAAMRDADLALGRLYAQQFFLKQLPCGHLHGRIPFLLERQRRADAGGPPEHRHPAVCADLDGDRIQVLMRPAVSSEAPPVEQIGRLAFQPWWPKLRSRRG